MLTLFEKMSEYLNDKNHFKEMSTQNIHVEFFVDYDLVFNVGEIFEALSSAKIKYDKIKVSPNTLYKVEEISGRKLDSLRNKKINFNEPIALVLSFMFRNKYFFVAIDGNHRIEIAKENGLKNISAYIIKVEDVFPYSNILIEGYEDVIWSKKIKNKT